MEVTEVRISPAKGGRIRAFASVVFDDCFIVNDLRVVEGREGQVFLQMPARKTRNGQMRDIAHPLDAATRELIEKRVIEEYFAALDSRVVPGQGGQGQDAKERPTSVLDRLASRLFNDEFWTVDTPTDVGGKD